MTVVTASEMRLTFRPLEPQETETYPFGKDCYVTVDDDASRAGYNCHGFALGVGDRLGVSDGPAFWRSMGYQRRAPADLTDHDQAVALFRNDRAGAERWHSAKRLRGLAMRVDLYESKCGTNWPDPKGGLRIVHPLHAIESVYGVIDSYWVRLTTSEANEQRRAELKREYNVDERDPVVEDSSDLVNEMLAEILATK